MTDVFLKICASEIRTSENCASQGPSVPFLPSSFNFCDCFTSTILLPNDIHLGSIQLLRISKNFLSMSLSRRATFTVDHSIYFISHMISEEFDMWKVTTIKLVKKNKEWLTESLMAIWRMHTGVFAPKSLHLGMIMVYRFSTLSLILTKRLL